MLKKIYQFMFIMMGATGCSPDYGIVGHDKIYIEVPVEVPGDPVGKQWVDSFVQPSSVEGVDILWVIDTSGSMADDYTRLIGGIEAMINNLPPTGWRLNMISNSPNVVHQDQQFPLVPGDDIIDAEYMYSNMYVGHYEEGFDASYEYIINNPYAPTWMRWDAALLIVFVSDEDDQSDMSVNEFTNWYVNLRPSVFLASIVHLDPSESACNTYAMFSGQNYIDATNYFNGVIVDICSEDWTPGVTDASNQVEPYEWYELTYTPIEDSIRVFIDHSPNNKWYYDSLDNTVYFTETPPSGAWVEIAYRHKDSELRQLLNNGSVGP